MKKIISLVLVLMIVAICYIKRDDIISLYSEVKETVADNILDSEDIVEIKYEEYEIRDPQFKSCYNVLNSDQRIFYRTIYSISQEMTEGFVKLGYDYDGAPLDVAIAYKAFLYDNPEIFWMPKDYILGTGGSGEKEKIAIAFDYHKNGNDYDYAVTKNERAKMEKRLDAAIEEVLEEIETLPGEYEKEKYINDFICDNVTYDEKAEFSDTAYGALINGRALCEGYSKAFMFLCNKAGIECELIVGESEGVGHMWNRVNIDKKLSYVDVTWNDRSELRIYTYFNITGEQLLDDHSIAPIFSEIKTDLQKKLFNFTEKDCSFTGNTFYEKNDRVLWSDYPYHSADVIRNAYDRGENYAEFLFATKDLNKEFNSDPEDFIKKIQNELDYPRISGYSAERDTVILFFE